MGNWTVYKHTNKINGKSYIGITSRKPEDRWGTNGYKYQSQKSKYLCFSKAIQKYGWDNFTHEILFTGLTKEDACKKEKELISFYNSKAPFGYNLTDGGEGTSGYEVSEEFKQRRSELVANGNNPKARKVIYGDKIFETIDECASFLNVGRNKIVRWITGLTIIPEIHLKNNLRFADEPPNYKTSRKSNSYAKRKVLFDGKVYDSIKECAKEIGVSPNVLNSWLKGEKGIKKEYAYLLESDLTFLGEEQKIRKANYKNLIDNFHGNYGPKKGKKEETVNGYS